MPRSRILLALAAAAILTGVAGTDVVAAERAALRVSINESNGAPFAMFDEQRRLQAGLARDIIDAYSNRMQMVPDYRQVHIDPLWVEPDSVFCAFSREFAAAMPNWQDPLQALIDEGRIASWVAAYAGQTLRAQRSRPTSNPSE